MTASRFAVPVLDGQAHGELRRRGPVLIHQLIREQALRRPDALAVLTDEVVVTFDELERRSNQLAHRLRAVGVGPQVRVGVHLDRSPELVVALLAVHKAGGAYLPLDPAWPAARLGYMVADSGTRVLVTRDDFPDELTEGGVIPVRLDRDAATIAGEPDGPPEELVTPIDLAYTVYTSGSTGTPKGVLVAHKSLWNLCTWKAEAFGITAADRGTLISPVSFDAAFWEMWPFLLSGASIVAIDEETRTDPAAVLQWIHRFRITVAFLPAALYELFIALPDLDRLPVRLVTTGGEVIRRRPRSGTRFRVMNVYGPTETTVATITAPMAEAGQENGSIPIGLPIGGTTAYVVDEWLRPVPDGEPGELCIGGAGVALGYHRQPGLTADRFRPDPFAAEPGARLYRTGDQVRRRPDGLLEFLGRVDRQVKIRGYRLELAETESLLLEHPAVRQVAVDVYRPADDPQLVAYVVAEPGWVPVPRLVAERLANWRAVLDRAQAEAGSADRASISGWNSSYTGALIPADEMRDWQQQTVRRLRALRPRRMLEIGCGAGLICDELAPECAAYTGTDFAGETLAALRRRLAATGRDANVTLLEREATDFTGLPARHFDTVVLNSVVQYFPSLEYLLTVLERAVEATADGGAVFVGDVRNLALLPAFQAWVALHGAADGTVASRLRAEVDRAIAEEQELVLSPALFDALRARLRRISAVEVEPKRGPYRNEMARYRYDVVLRVGRAPQPAVEPRRLDWYGDRLDLASLRQRLAGGDDRALVVTGIPNALVHDHVTLHAVLSKVDGGAIAGEIRARAVDVVDACAPEQVDAVAAGTPYRVRLSWAAARDDGSFDAVFTRGVDTLRPDAAVGTSLAGYANEPLRPVRDALLARTLREYLVSRVPEYMVPSAFTVLDALPVTPSGKIDRARLPAPLVLATDGRPFTAPRTPAEETIAGIVAGVLGLPRVGVHDDLLALGAHSLTLTQISNRVTAAFSVELPYRAIYATPTVEAIAWLVEDALLDEVEAAFSSDGSGTS